jgi:hypothetical protein
LAVREATQWPSHSRMYKPRAQTKTPAKDRIGLVLQSGMKMPPAIRAPSPMQRRTLDEDDRCNISCLAQARSVSVSNVCEPRALIWTLARATRSRLNWFTIDRWARTVSNGTPPEESTSGLEGPGGTMPDLEGTAIPPI